MTYKIEGAFPPQKKKDYRPNANGEYIKHESIRRLKELKKTYIKATRQNQTEMERRIRNLQTTCVGKLEKFHDLVGEILVDRNLWKRTTRAITREIDSKIKKMKMKHIEKCIATMRGWDVQKLCRYAKRQQLDEQPSLTSITQGNQKLTKPYNIINAFTQYWRSLYISKKEPKEWEASGTEHPLDEILPPFDSNQQINWEMTWDDFQKALKDIAKNKAPGASGIGTEILEAMNEQSKKKLFQFLKFCWDKKWIPKEWRHSQVVLIPKGGKNEDVTNYRPIALQEATYKLFSSILLEKVLIHMEKNKILSQLQFGGTRPNPPTSPPYLPVCTRRRS